MDLLQNFLFVPADSSRKMASARSLHPDALIYDLEDAVSLAKKAEARHLLAGELANSGGTSAKIFIRVNSFDSEFFEEDLRASVRPGVFGVILPKCHDVAAVSELHQRLQRLENQIGMPEGTIKIVPILETAKGVARASELARSSSRIIALFFGGEDFCADMGIVRTKTGDEISFARSHVALSAKAERLAAIDGPFTDFHDDAGLFEETRRVRQMGFTAKALIHPNQIDTVHRAFAPSGDEIAFAEEVVKEFEKSGEGVAVVRGKMIDAPVVAQARTVLQRSNRTSNSR
ncbi:MAG: CoA ester lyase [Acidobacteriota bacterium]|nr:CoA ester lyase [Acidobacteriota bacterium]